MAKNADKNDPSNLEVNERPDENNGDALARTALRPNVKAAITLRQYGSEFGPLDLTSLVDALTEQTSRTIDGNMERAAAMLTAQAHTLDAIYNSLARRAINAEYMDHLESYLKLALRAQSQCRATWEAISSIENPLLVGYVKQANIAHGPQQINNGTQKNPTSPTKLSGEIDELHQDTGTPGIEKKDNSPLEAMGKIDRATNARR